MEVMDISKHKIYFRQFMNKEVEDSEEILKFWFNRILVKSIITKILMKKLTLLKKIWKKFYQNRNFFQIFFKYVSFLNLFIKIFMKPSFSAPWAPLWGPKGSQGPRDQYNVFFEKIDFWDFFDVGPLFRYKRYFNTIIRCWDLARSIDLGLLFILT